MPITILFKKARGFTLPELMVALVLNIVVISALITFFSENLKHYNTTLNINRLNQQLEAVMQYMANDIRRAGYWANASNDLGTNNVTNPFMSTASGTDIATGASNTCILFTYDRNGNGTLPSISSASDDERYGFRLTNQAVQTRPWGASFSCAAAANAWENITDTTFIQITALTFTLNTQTVTTGPGTVGIIMRSVDITLTGRLTSDNTITKTLTQHIRIRNDKYHT